MASGLVIQPRILCDSATAGVTRAAVDAEWDMTMASIWILMIFCDSIMHWEAI
jgi:hypothetical protein